MPEIFSFVNFLIVFKRSSNANIICAETRIRGNMLNFDWLLQEKLLDQIAKNPLYVAIISAALTVILFPFFKWVLKKLWKFVQKSFKNLSRNRRFLDAYIRWAINANKYICFTFYYGGSKERDVAPVRIG